jgi:peptide/nickel transport system permease protein
MINPAVEQSQLPQAGVDPLADFETGREIGYYRLIWQRFRRHRLAGYAAYTLVALILVCLLGPVLLPSSWDNPDLLNRFAGPGWPHIMGTDDLGRDLFRRVLDGGRVSLSVGFLAMTVTIAMGALIGATAGYVGGIIDNLAMRLTDAILSIPQIFLLILIIISFGQGGHTPPVVVLAIGITSWPTTARVIRSVVLSIKEREFIEAARATGSSGPRILAQHVIPNALGPIAVSATLTIGFAILLESALSYLGHGLGPPLASWGSMLFYANAFIATAPTAALFPGFMILLAVLCVNFIGDGLRDAFDPRSVER